MRPAAWEDTTWVRGWRTNDPRQEPLPQARWKLRHQVGIGSFALQDPDEELQHFLGLCTLPPAHDLSYRPISTIPPVHQGSLKLCAELTAQKGE